MNTLKMHTAIAACIGLASLAAAQTPPKPEPTLKIGDPAPAINVMSWPKGKAVTSFEPGKVYVVEFWATWCGPCKIAMPHLSEMARHYGDKVTVLSVDVWENRDGKNPEYAPKVEAFVKQRGSVMDYNVAIDGAEATMAKTWLTASGASGIPNAYVITQDGKIGWMGHPLGGMEEAIDLALAGKLDAKASAALNKVQEANRTTWSDLSTKANRLMNEKKYVEAKAAVDAMDTIIPGFSAYSINTRYQILARSDAKAAKALGDKHFKANYNNDTALLGMPSFILTGKDQVDADYNLALKMLLRANELSPEPSYRTMDQIALAYSKIGNLGKAVEYQEKAISMGEAANGPAVFMDAAKKRLEEYRAQTKN